MVVELASTALWARRRVPVDARETIACVGVHPGAQIAARGPTPDASSLMHASYPGPKSTQVSNSLAQPAVHMARMALMAGVSAQLRAHRLASGPVPRASS